MCLFASQVSGFTHGCSCHETLLEANLDNSISCPYAGRRMCEWASYRMQAFHKELLTLLPPAPDVPDRTIFWACDNVRFTVHTRNDFLIRAAAVDARVCARLCRFAFIL